MNEQRYFGVCVASLLAIVACRQGSSPDPHAPHAAHATGEHAQHDPHAQHDQHAGHVLPAEKPLPGASVYNTTARFSDQHGKPLELASLRGSVVLATMFYGSCTSVCPMLVAQLARVDGALAPEDRARTQVVLVSLDPARDTTDKLQAVARRHGITDPRWHFVRTDESSVREVAALLGVRYSALPDGEISHSPVIALLDRDGALVTRMENAGGDPAELIAGVASAAGR